MREISLQSALEMLDSSKPVVVQQGIQMLTQLAKVKDSLHDVAPIAKLIAGPRAAFVDGKMREIQLSPQDAALRTSIESALRKATTDQRRALEGALRIANQTMDTQKRKNPDGAPRDNPAS